MSNFKSRMRVKRFLTEAVTDDWDGLQSSQYDKLETVIKAWVKQSDILIKKYAKANGEDYDEIRAEFYSYFQDNGYWDEFTN